MAASTIWHVGIHVRDIEEELAFLVLLGAELTSVGESARRGRIAFVSLDRVWHHTSLCSRTARRRRAAIAAGTATDSRESVDGRARRLTAQGVAVDGPRIQGPKDSGPDEGSGSYGIFFRDPNGVCFEIFTKPMTVSEYRARAMASLGNAG